MQSSTETGAVQIYAHMANAAFAERLGAALDQAGYRIVTGPFDPLAVDAVLVVWSGAAIGSDKLLAAAREPRDCGVMAPISIGKVEPPVGFQHLPPIDLGGWSGDAADPRWRAVLAELDRIATVRGGSPAAATLHAPVRHDALPSVLEAAAERIAPVVEAAVARVAALRLRLPTPRRATLATAAAIIGPLAIGGALFLTPNGDTPPVVAENDKEPPLLAALEVGERPLLIQESKAAELEGEPAAQEAELVAPVVAADLFAPVSAPPAEVVAEEEAEGEGDADFEALEEPAPEPRNVARTPRLAPTRLAALQAPDRIASLIESETAEGDAAPYTEEIAPAFEGPFKDCALCPEMAALPAGEFRLGSPADEPARQPAEGPQVGVAIPRAFAIGVKEVTFAEWDACVADGGCKAYAPSDAGWGRSRRPVVNVSWEDAQAYVKWLSDKSGVLYRLPSEAEWEYAARAGAETPFFFGQTVTTDQANFDGAHPYGGGPGAVRGRTTPAGSFAPNSFGLYDMHGNAWEWVADCWKPGHGEAPADAAPVGGACDKRVLKGGAWNTGGWRLRAGHRIGKPEGSREFDNGFRVARDLG